MHLRIAAFALALLAQTACATDRDDVELVYRETADWCSGCPGFELKFQSGGHVWFTGLAGCAVPGAHHFQIPASDFEALVQALHRARFFRTPRTGTTIIHAGEVTVAYRDRARVHEVEDLGRRDPRLDALQRQIRTTGRPERFLTPSADLYRDRLRSRWDVNSKNDDGWTALRCAISHNNMEAVRVLVENNVNASGEDLLFAAWRNSATLSVLVPAAQLDPRSQAAVDVLVTHARTKGAALPDMLRYGIPVDSVGANGKTALIAAINAASDEYVSADLNAAANAASRANVTLLLSHGANPNLTLGNRTPLHHAAVSSETGLIGILRRHAARIDSRDANGETPLMHAARSCSYWNIPALLQAGADVRAVSDDGRTALDFVAPKTESVVGGEFAYNRKNCQLTLETLRAAP